MTNTILKNKKYSFTDKKGTKKAGIFEGKIISHNPRTIIQIRDIKDDSILYNVDMDNLTEIILTKNEGRK